MTVIRKKKRFRAKREQNKTFQGILPVSEGHNLASTVFYVPYSLDSGPAFKAHRLVYHSTLGMRVIKKKKDLHRRVVVEMLVGADQAPGHFDRHREVDPLV